MSGYKDISNEELITRAHNGDQAAKNELVENNTGLIWSIVKRFQNRGCETEDLFQIGSIGLLKAIEKFNPSYNVKFSTYAVPMILGEIKRFLRDDGIIKVSRSLKETSNKARVIKEIMTKELGREPTINEIALRLDISSEDLVMAVESAYAPESLFNTCGNDDSSQSAMLIDRIDAEKSDVEMDMVDRIALMQLIDTLGTREKQIIMLRYFREKTQVQVAEMLGISQVQVSRIEKKILQELREKMHHECDRCDRGRFFVAKSDGSK
jgi:RNA polymerase sporulation-specific sigma factor